MQEIEDYLIRCEQENYYPDLIVVSQDIMNKCQADMKAEHYENWLEGLIILVSPNSQPESIKGYEEITV